MKGGMVFARYTELLVSLDRFRERLDCFDPDKDQQGFFEAMWQVTDYFKSFDDKEVFYAFLDSDKYLEYQQYFTQKNICFEPMVDKVQAKYLLAQNRYRDLESNFSDAFSAAVFAQAKVEFSILSNKPQGTLMLLGCGATPETLLCFALAGQFNKIIGVDRDLEALNIAQSLVDAMDIKTPIQFLHADAEKINYTSVDHVHMANFLRGKAKIMRQICLTLKPGGQVIMRYPYLLQHLFYEDNTGEQQSLEKCFNNKKIVTGRGGIYSFKIFM